MTTTDQPPGVATTSHPTVAAVEAIGAAIDEAFETAEWTQDPTRAAQTTTMLTSLEDRLTALKLRNLAHADQIDVPAESGAASTTSWLAHATRTTRPDAHRITLLAKALVLYQHRQVREALAAGSIRVAQARVIVNAVDALPDDLGEELLWQAEEWLLEQAATFDAAKLKVLGDHLLEVVAPAIAEAIEAEKFAERERKAEAKMRLTMSSDGQGSVFVRATIPDLYAAMLKKILLAYAAPKHQAATQTAGEPKPERRPSPERLGRAFCEFLESISDKDVPAAGGTGATVVVTMDLDTLLGGLKPAWLDNGDLVSAATARRLACQAGLIPAVLGGDSVPLDLGRTRRFHTRAQRIAIALRDGGCTAEGCDWPPGMCHVHHDPAWSAGGVTDVDHARMLCPFHHARAHDTTYETTKLPDGTIRFHRRT